MECNCMIDSADGRGPEFLRERRVKARKKHTCCECHGEILPGENYEYVSGIWDGSFDVFKTCQDCVCSYLYEGIWEDVEEVIRAWEGAVPEACMRELTPKARAKVCTLIDRIWKEED